MRINTFRKITVITLTIFLASIFYSCSDSKTNLFKVADLPAKKMTLIGDTVGGMTNRVLVCYTIDNGVKLNKYIILMFPIESVPEFKHIHHIIRLSE